MPQQRQADAGDFRFGLDPAWLAAFDSDVAVASAAVARAAEDTSGKRAGIHEKAAEAKSQLREMRAGPAELDYWARFPV